MGSPFMLETIASLVLLIGILVISAIITNWFVRRMYNRCRSCGTLNAKRRMQCRACQESLIVDRES